MTEETIYSFPGLNSKVFPWEIQKYTALEELYCELFSLELEVLRSLQDFVKIKEGI